MKPTLFLILSCLLFSGLAITTTEILRKVSESDFGKTLLDTIHIELEATTNADPRPKILELLQEIKEEALNSLTNLNEGINAQRQTCQNIKGSLDKSVAGLTADVGRDSAELSAKQTDEASTADQSASIEQVLSGLRNNLEASTQTRKANQASFESQDQRLADLITVLETARNFIINRLDARDDENPTFLQTNNVLLQVKSTVESDEFKKVSPGWGRLVSFIATKASNQLRQDGDAVAEAGLQSNVDLINEILAGLGIDRARAQATNDEEIAAFEKEKSELEAAINSNSVNLAANNNHLASLNGRIQELGKAIQANNDLINQKNAELRDNKRSCQNAEDTYVSAFEARNAELGLIDEVIAIVQNDLSNLRQFTEDTIANSNINVDNAY